MNSPSLSVVREAAQLKHRIGAFRSHPEILALKPAMQHYAWGDPNFIPALLGDENPDGRPCAELWMGAHPDAPAGAVLDGSEQEHGEELFGPAELGLAKQIIQQIAHETFAPEKYQDEVQARMRELIAKKVEGQEITVAPEAPAGKVIDLMEALKASLGMTKDAERKPAGHQEGSVDHLGVDDRGRAGTQQPREREQ